MKYAVVTIDWLAQHGLLAIPTMRKSKDGSKVILHEQYLTPYKDEEFPIYYFDSPELNALLASEEWSWSEEEAPEGSAEFIQVAAAQNLLNATKAGIQTMSLTDNEALQVKSMYPYWNEFIGKSLTTGIKVQYNDGLYRVRQNIATVLENSLPASIPQLFTKRSMRLLEALSMIQSRTTTIWHWKKENITLRMVLPISVLVQPDRRYTAH